MQSAYFKAALKLDFYFLFTSGCHMVVTLSHASYINANTMHLSTVLVILSYYTTYYVQVLVETWSRSWLLRAAMEKSLTTDFFNCTQLPASTTLTVIDYLFWINDLVIKADVHYMTTAWRIQERHVVTFKTSQKVNMSFCVIASKSLSLWPSRREHNPMVFRLKRGQWLFWKSLFLEGQNELCCRWE